MAFDPTNPRHVLFNQLLAEYKSGEKGMSVDTNRIRSILVSDPEGVAGIFPVLLQWNSQNAAGIWGLLYVISVVYKTEYDDDSLAVLLETAARVANVKLPSIVSMTPHKPPAEPKLNILEMDAADVRAGDAHRLLTVMSIETMSAEVRNRVIGHCSISFPLNNDPRPIQRIPEVRRFVADLHRRMRYFPLYLDFNPKLSMHLVYFGCLADEAALEFRGDTVAVNLLHKSVVGRMEESFEAIQITCNQHGLDWKGPVRGILAIFDANIRRSHFRREWDV